MNEFERSVLELGTKPPISKGTISPERRQYDKAFLAMLDGGIQNVGLPIYARRQAKKVNDLDSAATQFLKVSHAAA